MSTREIDAYLAALGDDVAGYEQTKGSLHFPIDTPLPERLVKKLVTTRMRELRARTEGGPGTRPRGV